MLGRLQLFVNVICRTPTYYLAHTAYGTIRFSEPSNAHIIHEGFYCNSGFATTTGLHTDYRGVQAGGLAARPLNILFQVCFGPSRLHAPVSLRDSAIS